MRSFVLPLAIVATTGLVLDSGTAQAAETLPAAHSAASAGVQIAWGERRPGGSSAFMERGEGANPFEERRGRQQPLGAENGGEAKCGAEKKAEAKCGAEKKIEKPAFEAKCGGKK